MKDAYAALVERHGNGQLDWTGEVRFLEDRLTQPLHWKQPRRIFVNSMSDLFHESVPDEWIDKIFAVMALTPQHTHMVLTKRPERMHKWMTRPSAFIGVWMEMGQDRFQRMGCPSPTWPLPNVWLGVSVENQSTADERIPWLLKTPAAVRFVSYEPALGPVDFRAWLTPEYIACGESSPSPETTRAINVLCRAVAKREGLPLLDWVICGGESGHNARPCDLAWIRSVVQQCQAAGVACFLKQLGAKCEVWNRDHTGMYQLELRDRKGADIEEFPEDLRVREFPQ